MITSDSRKFISFQILSGHFTLASQDGGQEGRQRARKKERELYLIALSGIFRVFDHRFIDKKVFRFTDNVDIVYMKIFAKFQKFLRSSENMNFEGANSYLVIKSSQRVVEEGKFGKNWESGGIVFPNAVIFLRVQT